MATNAKMTAQPRAGTGKSVTRKMRAAGRIPGVVYGHGEATRMVSVDAHELDLLFKRVHWENTLIEVTIEGEKRPVRTLVREVQSHAYRPEILHVDFQQIHAGEVLHMDVPVRLIGTAPGVKEGGVLMHAVTDLPIRCTPDRIPEFIDVDISALGVGDAVHLAEITLPEGVEAEIDADRTICSVTPPSVAATTPSEEAAEPAMGEPEVVGHEETEDAAAE